MAFLWLLGHNFAYFWGFRHIETQHKEPKTRVGLFGYRQTLNPSKWLQGLVADALASKGGVLRTKGIGYAEKY